MNFHTADDGHIYNDEKKSSSTHHGSIQPKSGIKLKKEKVVDPQQEYIDRFKKLSETGRYKADIDHYGFLRSNHIYNLDDINRGKEIVDEMELIIAKSEPEKEYSVKKYFDENDERVKDGTWETLGRNASVIKPFLDYRLHGDHDGKHWMMAVPLAYMPKNGHNLVVEDSGGFQTDAYKNKLDYASVSPTVFINDWAAKIDFNSEGSRKTIEKYKKMIEKGVPLSTPFIQVDSKTGKIYQHEGRHRAEAALELGVEKIPVEIIYDTPWDNISEKKQAEFARKHFIKQSF